jgi:hypothetical protein
LSSGFIGADEFMFIYAGFLLIINTFGGEIMFFLLLIFGLNFIHEDNNDGLLMYARKTGNENFEKNEKNEKKLGNEKNKNCLLLLSVWCTYKLYVLTLSCFGALLHRRHLMVWAVFAPKVSTYMFIYMIYVCI